jgi:hypothetical protein
MQFYKMYPQFIYKYTLQGRSDNGIDSGYSACYKYKTQSRDLAVALLITEKGDHCSQG